MPLEPTRLGLTGGIGSGKSTIAKIFAALGAVVIDADAISRSLTASRGAAIETIKQLFGQSMISEDGSLDRNRMRELVFTDADAKKRLESIIHPLVKHEIQRLEQKAILSGAKLIIYDIPLLVESTNWRPVLDLVIVVDCREQTQIERVTARNTLAQKDVKKIIANQAKRKMRNGAADILIFNDSISLEQLNEEVMHVYKHLESQFDDRKIM